MRSNYPSLDTNAIGGQLLMKPKIKVRTQAGRKDFGELSICENGIKYKYFPAGSVPIDCFVQFRQIRNIAY